MLDKLVESKLVELEKEVIGNKEMDVEVMKEKFVKLLLFKR